MRSEARSETRGAATLLMRRQATRKIRKFAE
jgi:hypothetical protein